MGRDGLLGAFEEMVLVVVARGGGDAYGMTVRREIEERTGREITIGAVYSTLDRLETKGYLRSRLGDSADGRRGRARRHFRVMPSGVGALARVREMRDGLWDGLNLSDVAAEAESGS